MSCAETIKSRRLFYFSRWLVNIGVVNLYTNRAANIRKTWLLMAIFFGVVIGAGFVFSRVYGSPGILYIAVGFSILMNAVSYWYSDKIVIKMTGAKELPDEGEYKNIHNIVMQL